MEGADSFIAYLPEEEEDAQETKKMVEKYGRKCWTYGCDLKERENCKKVVEEAVREMGGIDILFNNHAYQMMTKDISEISEEQWLHTFDTNIHRTSLTPSPPLPLSPHSPSPLPSPLPFLPR